MNIQEPFLIDSFAQLQNYSLFTIRIVSILILASSH